MKVGSSALLWTAAWLGASSSALAFSPISNQNHGVVSSSNSSSSLHMFNPKFALVRTLAGDYDQAAAKELLAGLGLTNYKVVELDQDEDGKAIRAEMIDLIGRTSVPAVWIQGQYVGGCNDGGPYGGLVSMKSSGKLQELLQQAGVL